MLQRLHAEKSDLMDKIAEGNWDDSIESELGDAIAEAIDDFGADFDEEGNPLEEGESDRIKDEEGRRRNGGQSASGKARRGRGEGALPDATAAAAT